MNSLEKVIEALKGFLGSFQNINLFALLIAYCLIQFLVGFIRSEFVATDQIYSEYIDSKLSEEYGDLEEEFEEDIEDFDSEDDEEAYDSLIDLGISIVWQIIRISFVSILILAGFSLTTDAIQFKHIFRSVVISGFILLLPTLIEISWFLLIKTEYTYADIETFKPFSLYALFGSENVSDWLIYPAKTINIFEILYVILIATGISEFANAKFSKSIVTVASTYSIMLLMLFGLRIYFSSVFIK